MKNHIDTGLRKILEAPSIYNLFGNLVGSNKIRREYFNNYFSLPKGSKVLDIACGTGIMLECINDGIEYYGFDMQEEYIQHAREKYGERGNFYVEKVGGNINSKWEGYFDAINAHGILHHISDEDGLSLLKAAYAYLKPNGYFMTQDTAKHKDQGIIENWLVSNDRGQNVKNPKGYLELANSVFDQVEGKLLSNHLNIPYSAFVMKMIKN